MLKTHKPIRCFASLIALISSSAISANAAESFDKLVDASFKELSDKKVYSVSKFEENAQQASASVFVLTNEDVRRSGATSVPELLRLVPGLQVARTSSNKWAISARGFNDGFANKLLVLIDGRSVFTPQFSGVFWDAQDVILADIERIEVIKGPGATLWGANAVNGVINITTKHTKDTVGSYLNIVGGNDDQIVTEARYGGKIKNGGSYRAYAKYFDRHGLDNTAEMEVDNGWHFSRGGFRLDGDELKNTKWTFQGDIYDGVLDTTLSLPNFVAPSPFVIEDMGDISGGNILGRLHHLHEGDSDSTLQLYYDRTERHFYNIEINIETYDLDYQNVWDINSNNQLITGFGYRYVDDHFKNSQWFAYMPSSSTESVVNAFIQNKTKLMDDRLVMTLGSKFERNNYSGFEIQPNARFSYAVNDTNTLWGAVSRAVRTPTRSEEDIELAVAAVPGAGFVGWIGDDDAESEDLIAYELGYRWQYSPRLDFDLSLFFNDYSKIRTFEASVPFGNFIAPFRVNNLGEAESYGGELVVNALPMRNLNVVGSYSYLWMDVDLDPLSTDIFTAADEGKSPSHQVTLRTQYNITDDIEFDNTYHYTSKLESIGIEGYSRFDSRLSWKPIDGMTLSAVGQNLLGGKHREFSAAFNESAMKIGRTYYGSVSLEF